MSVQTKNISCMKIHLVSYATPDFKSSQDGLVSSARKFGIDSAFRYMPENIRATSFYKKFQKILDAPRGAGYWLWKPFWIKEVFNTLSEGDILIYSDAGISVIGDLQTLFTICKSNDGIMLFHAHYDDIPGAPGPCVNRRWTKRDCFVKMDCNESRYFDAHHFDGSFQIYQKTRKSSRFIDEYLKYCCAPEILTDQPSQCGMPELPGFIAHREDQSVLSLLAEKWGCEGFRHPSQYGNHLKMHEFRVSGELIRLPYSSEPYSNSPYPTLLDHHRTRC